MICHILKELSCCIKCGMEMPRNLFNIYFYFLCVCVGGYQSPCGGGGTSALNICVGVCSTLFETLFTPNINQNTVLIRNARNDNNEK